LRVALYSPLDPELLGGMRSWLVSFWMPFLERTGYSLTIIHTGTRPESDRTAYMALPSCAQMTQVVLPGYPLPMSGGNLPSVTKLAEALEAHDVAYFDNGYAGQDVVFLAAARRARTPTISGHHAVILHPVDTVVDLLHNASWHFVGAHNIKRFDAVHALNTADGNALRKLGARNVAVIPPAIDRSLFSPGDKASEPTALFVGRLRRQKGIDRLPSIARAFHELTGDGTFLVVGSSSLMPELVSQQSSEHVQFTGSLDGRDVAELMRRAWLFVAPSRSETFGFAVAEAISSGTPVVCSRTNGFADIVKQESGVFVNAGDDVREWRRAMSTVLGWYDSPGVHEVQVRARSSLRFLEFDGISERMRALLESVT
jgi:glycosyltransferase involved in cell wall biosynthesis